MAGTTAWDKLSDEMSNGGESNFKEKALSLLRILDRSFQECLDISGIDFVVWSDKSSIDWAVQCHVFDVSVILERNHASEIISSTQAFLSQGIKCNKYWVIHNHQHGKKGYGKFLQFLKEIENYKECLKTEHDTIEFHLIQRQELLQKAEGEFRRILKKLLKDYSERYRVDIEEKLEFGKYYVPNVPVEEFEISFKEYEPLPNISLLTSSLKDNIAELIVSERKDIRWTLIHGEAGAGKTTTSLHTSIEKNKVVFFVNCDILDFYSLRRKGTNLFLEHIMRALNLLELFEDEKDRELLYSLSGATLAKTFEHSNEHILIFDGLDENRFYSDPSSEGLKRLSETLVDIHCPIILVTRTAHFEESLYSELGSLVEVNNSRGGSKVRRKARAIKLPVWSETHILQLLDKIFVDSGNKCLLSKQGLKRLHKFRNLFLDNSYKEFYGDLPLNPLFLQFILSDVVERDIHKVNRPILIYQWIRRKIFRDIKKENRSFPVNKKVPNNEILILVDKLLYLMELVSKSMTMACENGTFKINDFTDYREIQEAVAKTFGTGQVKAIDLLLNSALTSNVTLTRDKYRATKQKITFTFKIFQEYFLACYLVRNQECVALYPNNVKKFYEDIIKTEDENDLSFYLRNDFGSLEEKTSDLETENFGSFALPARVPVHIHTPKVTFMSEQIPDINISGGNFNGSTYFAPHHGDNIGTIKNYLGKDEIEELNKFVAEVEAKYPNVQNEVEAEEIFNAEVVAVRDSDQTRWEILREQMSIIKRQLLNKERHFQATKATVVEVAKAAFEKSLMAKAVITYIDKLSEEPDRGS